MNKYLGLVALVALVSVAYAHSIELVEDEEESEFALVPDNAEETAQLTGNLQIFEDFCLETRDYVVKGIKDRGNEAVANMFSIFFSEAEELGKDVVNAQRDATQRLANQMRNPDAAINEANADPKILETQQAIKENGVAPGNFFSAFANTLSATKNALTNSLFLRVGRLTSKLGFTGFASAIIEACNLFDQYDKDIQIKFEKYVKRLGGEARKMQLADVPCVTARRVIRVDGFCKFGKQAKEPLTKAITYKS